jgi:cytoskeletal protein CcmA (bactofilin family)
MFGKKKQPPIKSLVAHGSRIEGHYIFSEGLRVDGEVVGDIRANPDRPSILVISESAIGDRGHPCRSRHHQWPGGRPGACP